MNGRLHEFEQLYKMLNTEQRAAVDAIEGPVMVIAGPGTGKTQILTLRIANILRQTDVPADAVLALTFTNAAAANMRKRLVSTIGADAYRVSIYTFHSFANHLIERYPDYFSTIVGFSTCSDIERLDIIRSLLDQGQYTLLKPISNPYYHAGSIKTALQHLKREGITPDTFAAWVERERAALEARDDLMHATGTHKGAMKGAYVTRFRALDKNTELANLYARYQTELKRRHRYDFEDSLLALIDAMETHETFLRELQEQYQYFLVDEHQDTNGAQNRILELMASYFDTPNLFVVGDEKQAIFRFQGASLANFLYFEERFRDVKRITLDANYRSHQGVLDAAQAVIEKNRQGVQAPLTAQAPAPRTIDTRVKVVSFTSDEEELLYLAEAVKARLAEGVPPHEIAVLYRNNKDAEAIVDYFERLAIPYIVAADHGVLEDEDIRKLNTILITLTDLNADEPLAQLLLIDFLNVSVVDAHALIRGARERKRGLFATLSAPNDLPLEDPAAVRALADNLTAWKRSAENDSFLRFFEKVVRESGLLMAIQDSPHHIQKYDKLVQLFDELKALTMRTPFFTLQDYRAYLAILEEHALTLEARPRVIEQAVPLMTAHKAKGQEFDHVYVVHCYDGNWGGKRTSEFFTLPYGGQGAPRGATTLDDERRLFYVALTRARTTVTLTYASLAPDGRDRVPSQFIEEIRPDLKVEQTGDELGYTNKRPPLFIRSTAREGSERYRQFVQAAFQERGFSATSLNNYLACPWKWFYRDFVRVQFVRTVPQEKGTAIHRALEDYFNKRNVHLDVPVDHLLERFEHYLRESELEPEALDRIAAEATKALAGWHAAWSASWAPTTKNELYVRGVLIDDAIRLSGKLDKLECLDDACRSVRVVDYKTGRPKSRNEIEGTTMTARSTAGSGGYKRQLVFYKLLLDRYMDGAHSMEEGMLDFIEPMPSGRYKREPFAIGNADVNALADTIRTAAHEIQELAFWETRCGDCACAECALRDLMS